MRAVTKNFAAAGVMAVACAGCTTPITGGPAAMVVAQAQTQPVGSANEDAADDPAIWRNRADPARSLVVATDKKAALYVYDLDGTVRSFVAGGLLNNVDLVEREDGTVLVAASDRGDITNSQIALYRLDTASGELVLLGRVASGPGEAYGLCLSTHGGQLSAFAVIKDGRVREYALSDDAVPTATQLREFSVPSQAEGCAADPRSGAVYIGEEAGGIWRFAPGATTGEIVAAMDNDRLVADVEGLTLAPVGEDGGWLVASSQGDNAYAVWLLDDWSFAGRFRIAEGTFGSAEETDGIALALGDFGPDFPGGLFVAQDGMNVPEAQNFKLVAWETILAALAKGPE